MAIDPAVTGGKSSAETGFAVVGRDAADHYWVLHSDGMQASPKAWADHAHKLYNRYKADLVVAEVNQGGELVAANLRASWPGLPVRSVSTNRGKAVRAAPVANLYQQGRVHHVGLFPDLEDQLCVFGAPENEELVDRLDALVWAVLNLSEKREVTAEEAG